ncbi:hypothetical protein ACPUER_36780, partial [Burkholderia sp. DN3021]|uniref:hypothetical protein n=1 Tax=Burkholderia sp. DN3021 TaxID=3410137 RepID=UPI003C7B5650
LPEPRRNDLAIDDPDRRVYAFMNSAAGRERLIDELKRALDEWKQSPEYIAERDRDALAQGWALTAELEDTFANPLSEELAAKTSDYLYRNFVYSADNFNDLHSAKRDREAGSRSSREMQSVQENTPNPMRETGSHRASEAVPVFATSGGSSALEAQKASLLGAQTTTALAASLMATRNHKAGAIVAAGATLVTGAAYGLYRWLTHDSTPSGIAPSMLVDDESHDDEVVANLQIPSELEALISGATNAPNPSARRVRSASTKINPPNSIDGYKPNFSKYDDHVAENLRKVWEKIDNHPWARDDYSMRLIMFNGLLNSLINHDDKPSSRISDHLMVAAIAEFDALRPHLESDGRLREHLSYIDNYPHALGRFSKVYLYREAFAIKEIDEDFYASQRELSGNFIYRKR